MASPYDKSLILINDYGDRYLDTYDQSDLYNKPSSNTKTHIVKEGETLQSIAYKYYGDSGYWYRIVSFNKIINPFSVKPYTRLFIP